MGDPFIDRPLIFDAKQVGCKARVANPAEKTGPSVRAARTVRRKSQGRLSERVQNVLY